MGLQYSPSLFPNIYQSRLKKEEQHQEIEDKLLDSETPLEPLVRHFEKKID
jgi:hypothetical protein